MCSPLAGGLVVDKVDGLWNEVLGKLQDQLSGPTFETWIKPTRLQNLADSTLTISTPNPFARNWVQKHYIQVISDVVQELVGHDINVVVTVSEVSDGEANKPGDAAVAWPPPTAERTAATSKSSPPDLNPKAVFSRFVVGSNNRMAHAAALAVAESPGREFNPLFLCGGVGLGKTHLMQSIGHYRLDIDTKCPYCLCFYRAIHK